MTPMIVDDLSVWLTEHPQGKFPLDRTLNTGQLGQEQGCPGGTPSQYPEQFRKDAVALVQSSDRPGRQDPHAPLA